MSRARPRQGEILRLRREVLLLEKEVKKLFAKLDLANVTLATLNQFVIDNPPAEPVPPALQTDIDIVGSPDNTIEPSQ